MKKNIENNEALELKDKIKNGSALYFYRATPFTDHGEFNYNGALKEEFFFDNMFSEKGEYKQKLEKIDMFFNKRERKTILLIGNQGCGKTTFVHSLKRKFDDVEFVIFDFDKNTSHPTLSEYIEIFSKYLLTLLQSNKDVNKLFYGLYIKNDDLIDEKSNANNNIDYFFENFEKTFINEKNCVNKKEFIKVINELFFNQILSLIVLWKICKFELDHANNRQIKPIIFCLDNLDVLVNQDIIENFFKEYFRFVRNIDSIIQRIDNKFIKENEKSYNSIFSFLLCCRRHTWARVRQYYRQDHAFIKISTLELNLTNAFDKKGILVVRENYIDNNKEFYGKFKDNVSRVREILADMDTVESSHNIYDLFDDDYRQCNITFDEIFEENPTIIEDYFRVKTNANGVLYGARGIIYRAIFEKFKLEGIFDHIGVLEIGKKNPLVSNARMLLNYLDYYTYSENDSDIQQTVAFEKIVDDFQGIIEKDKINQALIAMFKLGDDSSWNQLIAFNEIHEEDVTSCEGTQLFITKAGHKYLDLIATHFEFFNIRIIKRRKVKCALFAKESSKKFPNEEYTYNFQEIIENVLEVVRNCCNNMSMYYEDIMKKIYPEKKDYLDSPFVYGEAGVLHGERIIHTHIRYIDSYRIYILSILKDESEKIDVNKILIDYIQEYINIGKEYPAVLTDKSIKKLFPAFEKIITQIKEGDYKDFSTKIDLLQRRK